MILVFHKIYISDVVITTEGSSVETSVATLRIIQNYVMKTAWKKTLMRASKSFHARIYALSDEM